MPESKSEASKFFIAVAGNIGCGKSSLTTLLSQRFGWKPFYEIVDSNPYLADFYGDMRRWSFQLQMFFLTKRFHHQQEIAADNQSVIQDRSIYEDAEIFAKNLYLHGKMEERDYRTYVDHFHLMTSYLKAPDLLVYLKTDIPTLRQRIEKRGREYEIKMPDVYLEQLNSRYDDWYLSYDQGPKIVIDVSEKDFVNNLSDLDQVAEIVRWELSCLQNRSQKRLPLAGAAKQKAKSRRKSSSGLLASA